MDSCRPILWDFAESNFDKLSVDVCGLLFTQCFSEAGFYESRTGSFEKK